MLSLTGLVHYETKNGKTHSFFQETGQLMGNYLSFPLLCISNIATLFLSLGSERAWFLIYKGLVRVNGDDIVFKALAPEIEKWKTALPKSGFVINETKTDVHDHYWTLNSQLFCGNRGKRRRVRKVWHLIPKGLFKKTNVLKKSDVMAAHAAVVRENVRGIPGNLWARTTRALMSIKKASWRRTSIKTVCAMSWPEYDAYPGPLKLAERVKAFECLYNPKKERLKGEKIIGKRRSECTAEEKSQSRIVVAEARFSSFLRETVVESNDRFITQRDIEDGKSFMFQAVPDYRRRKEEIVCWVREKVVMDDLGEPICVSMTCQPGVVMDVVGPWVSKFCGLEEKFLKRMLSRDPEWRFSCGPTF
jgi:hypothetical protein